MSSMADDTTEKEGIIKGQDHDQYELKSIEARLIILTGQAKGTSFKLSSGVNIIGRTAGDIQIADPKISRKHAVVEILGPDVYYVKDLASSNGTLVNQKPITFTKLQSGDVLDIGDTVFKFYVTRTE